MKFQTVYGLLVLAFLLLLNIYAFTADRSAAAGAGKSENPVHADITSSLQGMDMATILRTK